MYLPIVQSALGRASASEEGAYFVALSFATLADYELGAWCRDLGS
jgi:hypothetical protein